MASCRLKDVSLSLSKKCNLWLLGYPPVFPYSKVKLQFMNGITQKNAVSVDTTETHGFPHGCRHDNVENFTVLASTRQKLQRIGCVDHVTWRFVNTAVETAVSHQLDGKTAVFSQFFHEW